MTPLSSASGLSAQGRLHLLFSLGADRYALAATDVCELMPLRRLKQLPEAPAWVAGVLAYRGQMVPVIDLYQRLFGRAAAVRTSTRLVLVHYAEHILGLILEHASDLVRLSDDHQQASGVESLSADFLGQVQVDKERRIVQHIRVDGLLPTDLIELLFPSSPPQERT